MTAPRRDVRQIVFAALEDLGEATAVQIHAEVWKTGLTLVQVQSCCYNCQSEGHLLSTGRTEKTKAGPPEARYRLSGVEPMPRARRPAKVKERPSRAFASVWDYAQKLATN